LFERGRTHDLWTSWRDAIMHMCRKLPARHKRQLVLLVSIDIQHHITVTR
jgi:hypothetical protein